MTIPEGFFDISQEAIENRRAYWLALGRFIDMFSTVECTVQLAVAKFSNVKDSVARAVFSGVRIKEGSSFIRRIMEVTNHPSDKRADMEDVLKQLGFITDLRNEILHYGALPSDGPETIVTNKHIALTEDRITNRPVSKTILMEATNDLHKIQAHLVFVHLPPAYQGAPDDYVRSMTGLLTAAWRYIPPQQQKAAKKTLGAPPAQSPPPQSSQG